MANEIAYRANDIHHVGSATPAMIASQCAAVTTTAQGAMSAADKIKLDAVYSPQTISKTADYTFVQTNDNQGFFTNRLATATTGDFTITFPTPVIGMEAEFACVQSACFMKILVTGTSRIQYGPAFITTSGANFLRCNESGGTVKLKCLVSNQLNVIHQPMGSWSDA